MPINSHLAEFTEEWSCPGGKNSKSSIYSGMCRVLPEKNKDKASELTKYAHGVVRIVKHDGTVKEGCMRNGAWFGMYREVKGEEVTIRINYPGE